jgi:enterobactin synthetase component D
MSFDNFKLHSNDKPACKFIHNLQHWIHDTVPIQLIFCDFKVKHYKMELFDQLGIYFPVEIERAVPKRKAEFLAGRYAAKLAFKNFGFNKKNIPTIHIGKHRAPIWLEDFVGSITHDSTSAICAIGHLRNIKRIGVDIQGVLLDETVSDIASHIYNDLEFRLLLANKIPVNTAATLLFSAKETLFKALYQETNSYFGFECARLIEFNLNKKLMIFKLTDDFPNHHYINNCYSVHFKVYENYVISLMYEIQSPDYT